MAEEKLSFIEHLEELRKRIIKCLIAIAFGCAVSFYFAPKIFSILAIPIKKALPPNSTLIFTNPTEAFLIYFKTALIAGFFLTTPFILYQIWKFIAPGLYEREKGYVVPFVIISSILFIGGAFFGYFFVFPPAFQFLINSFASDFIKPLPSMKEYFSLATSLLLAFGVIFETPVLIFFLAKVGIVTYKMLLRFQKYAIVLAFIIAALLTPTPDIFNQSMMAVPLLILYEIGIIIAWAVGKKPKREEK